jgi:hypothetical protein
VFLDVEKMKIIMSLSARLVASSATGEKAVVRVGDRFEFVALEGGTRR